MPSAERLSWEEKMKAGGLLGTGTIVYKAPLPVPLPGPDHFCNPSGEGHVPTPGIIWRCNECGKCWTNRLFADWRPSTWRERRKARQHQKEA